MIAEKTLFYVTIDKSAVYPRVVLEEVLRYNSAGVILAHNHPSGNLRPSKQDIQLTEALQELLEKIKMEKHLQKVELQKLYMDVDVPLVQV